MKRKKIGIFLIAMTLLCGTAGFAACGGSTTGSSSSSNGSSGSNAQVEITGFEVKEEITVPNGSIVCPENMLVTDSNGELVNVWVEVTDSKGGIVSLNANAFNANDTQGYTITYVVRASDGRTYRKTTKVKVDGKATAIELSAQYEEIVEAGKPLTIQPVCKYDNVTYSYEVSHNDEAVEVAEDGTFTPTMYGEYDVKIIAQLGEVSEEYTYTFFARTPVDKGEIEKYDEEWAAYASFVGDMRMSSWSITDTETSGIKNRYGLDDTYLSSKTSLDYIPFYLMPRNDAEYYQALAEEGYEYMSGWVYVKGSTSHICQLRLDGDLTSSFYTKSGPKILANTWMQITYRLVDGADDWERSFASACQYYRESAVYFMLIDNSDAYNPDGHEDNLEIYYNDFYAVKPVEITAKENVKTEYKIGETFQASNYFDEKTIEDNALKFAVTVDGETEELTDGYAFDKNREYSIQVYSARRDLALSGATNFKVTATFDIATETDIVTVKANEKINLIDTFGIEVKGFELENATFSCESTAQQINGTEFTAAFGGTYDVYMTDIVVQGVAEKLAKSKHVQVVVDGYSVTNTKYTNIYDINATQTVDILAMGTEKPTDIPTGYTAEYMLFERYGATANLVDGVWTENVLDLSGLSGKYTALAVVRYGDMYTPYVELSMDVLSEELTFSTKNAPILAAVSSVGEKYDENISSEYVGKFEDKESVTKLSVSKHTTVGVAIDPAYTYEALTKLRTSGKGYYVVFQIKIVNRAEEPKYTQFNGNDVGTGGFNYINAGEWYTFTMKIGDAIHEGATDATPQYRYSTTVQNYLLAQAKTNPTENIKKGYLVNLNLNKEDVEIYVTTPKLLCQDSSEKVVDKNIGTEALNLSDIVNISDFNTTSHELAWTLDGEAITGSTIDPETLTEGSHALKLVVKPIRTIFNNYILRQEVTVYDGAIDVYDSSKGPDYAEISQAYIDAGKVKHSKYVGNGYADVISAVTAAEVAGDTDLTMGEYVASGNYYLYDTSTSTNGKTAYTEHGIWVKPNHSKYYYETMKKLGYTEIEYDYYIVDPNGVTGSVQYNGAVHTEAQKNTWQTASISIDNLIAYYDHYNTGLAYYPDSTTTQGGHYRYTELLHLGWKSAYEAKFYLGNFRIVKGE